MSKHIGNNAPIGVFDSGLGGLSVLSEVHQLLPSEKLIYVGDSAFSPYGDLSPETIRHRSFKIVNFLINQNAKAIVIACNTATVETIDLIRERVDIPIIGLEPAIKPATILSKNSNIGVLATQRTVESNHLKKLIEKYAKDKNIIIQACPGLVEQVETGNLSNKRIDELLQKYINPMLLQNIDTLVLGCTHYPFLIGSIRNLVGNEVEIVETSQAVSRQLHRVLKENSLENTHSDKNDLHETPHSNISFYNSDTFDTSIRAMQRLWQTTLTSANSRFITKAIEVQPLPTLN